MKIPTVITDAAANIKAGLVAMWTALPQRMRDFVTGLAVGTPLGAVLVAAWLS